MKKLLTWGIVLFGLLLSTPIEATKSTAVQGKQFARIPVKNMNFVGRSKELNVIEDNLKSSYSIFAIIGLSGVGKTQLIKQYAHQSKGQYEMTWWFDASSPLQPQFVQLANSWNKSATNSKDRIPQAAIEGPEIIEVVKERLSQDEKSWLLVFDNAENIDTFIENYIPRKTNGDSNHHMLITSKQSAKWKSVLKLTPLSRSESIKLLEERIDHKKQGPGYLNDLADMLGDIPLTLVQAASYIQLVPSLNIEKYIELFKDNHGVLERLEHQITTPSNVREYEKTFLSTMWLTLQKLKETSPVSYEFLLFCAFIDHKGITEALITDWLKNNDHDTELLHEITYNLTSRFLIEKKFEEQNSPYEMHQFVQGTIHRLIPDERKQVIFQKAEQLFLSYIEQDTWVISETLSQSPTLYMHIKKIYNQLQYPSEQDASFMIHLAHAALFYKGDRDLVESLLAKIKPLLKKGIISTLGFNYARYLNTKAKFSFAENIDKSIEDTKESIKLLKLLKNDSRVNSELFLAIVNNLVDYYQIQGRVHEAKQACELFKDDINKFDQKIYGTLYYSFLALSEMYGGEYDQALESINVSHQHLQDGKLSDYLFIFVLVNKAEILARMGELETAQSLVERLRQDLKDIFQGKLNHLVIRVEMIHAFLAYSKSEFKNAEKKIIKSIKNYDALVGSIKKDPIQGFSHTLLGDLYYVSQKFKMALEEYKIAEHIYDTVLNAREIDDLGDLYKKIIIVGADKHNIEITKEYLKKLTSFFGLNHKKTQDAVRHLDEKNFPIPW